MRLAAPAAALAGALSLATAAVRGNRTSAPVHVVADKGEVWFSCSAPGIAIKITAAADVNEPGEATVAADRLGGVIAGFSSSSTITISTTASTAMIACGNSRYRLRVLPDAPAALAMDYEIARIEVAGNDLLTLFEVLPAVGTEQTRFYLNGLYMHNIGDHLVAVATDGVKLLRISITADPFSEDRKFILPSKSATALIKLIEQTKADKVTLRRSGALFAVAGPAFEFVTTLIDAEYPEYECLLPRASTGVAQCSRTDLIGALARLGAVANAELPPLVALSWIDGGPLHLFLPRQPGDAEDAIAAETRGSVQIALSLPQVTAMISNFSSDRLHLEAAGADAPLVLRGEQTKFGVLTSCRWNFQTREPSP